MSYSCSQRAEERLQVGLLAVGQTHPEPQVVELHHLGERRRRTVVKERGSGHQPPENRPLEPADVGALARDQSPSRV